MNEIIPMITIRNEEAWTTSLDVAENFSKEHKNVIKRIEELLENQLIVDRLLFKPISYKDANNREQPAYELNFDGFSLLAMGFTGDKALVYKLRYIDVFNKMRKIISDRNNVSWIEMRKTGKMLRREETDQLKLFVEYAVAQGSQNANKYYLVISKMTNQALGLVKEYYHNDLKLRDCLNIIELSNVMQAEAIIKNALIDGMNKELFYKDIYQLAKERIVKYAEMINPNRLAISNER